MKIQRFEDLQAWQQGRVLANLIYEVAFKQIYEKATEVKKIINGMISCLRKSKSQKGRL